MFRPDKTHLCNNSLWYQMHSFSFDYLLCNYVGSLVNKNKITKMYYFAGCFTVRHCLVISEVYQ